ncbi:unnamed protein product, partial [Cuscuta epithymum]
MEEVSDETKQGRIWEGKPKEVTAGEDMALDGPKMGRRRVRPPRPAGGSFGDSDQYHKLVINSKSRSRTNDYMSAVGRDWCE